MKRVLTTLMLIAVLCVSIANISYAQQKSPATAGLMSTVLPGLGQFYTNQSSKGLLLSSLYLGTMAMVITNGPGTWEDEIDDPNFGDLAEGTGTSGTVKAIWYGSAALAGGVLIYSVVDAVKAAKRINGENRSVDIVPYVKDDCYGIQLTYNLRM